jgi:hypothetical protein
LRCGDETPEWDTAEPALDDKWMDTAQRLMAMGSSEAQQAAMRWYRLAIQAKITDEQFSYFWFALEIAAETLKGTEKVASKCPKCGTSLFCETCATHPTHRRYPGEAVHKVIERVHPEGAEEVFKTLQTIRHKLMHGGRIASVIDKLPCTEQQAIDRLASVTWSAITDMFTKPDPCEDKGEPLQFGYLDSVVRRTIVGSAHITTRLAGRSEQSAH